MKLSPLALLMGLTGAAALAGCGSGHDDAYYERQAGVMAAQAEGTELQPGGNARADADEPAPRPSEVEQ